MQPNVCIVVLDAVRAQNLSCYGHKRKTTPRIDSVAEEGIIFEKAVSPAAVTLDSTASLFTGLYPGDHRAGQKGKITTDVPHIPELLNEVGYTTGAVTTNPFITPGFGFERGIDSFMAKEHKFKNGMNIRKFFDRYKDQPTYQIYLQFLFESLDRNFISHVANALQFRFELFTRDDNGAKESTLKTLDFINEHSNPWFLYTHYSESHMKNVDNLYKLPNKFKYYFVEQDKVDQSLIERNPDKPYNDSTMDIHERLYDGTIRYLDTQIGQIVDNLKSVGQWDDTFFVVTADHGECLGEHGAVGHGYLYEEAIKVPLIIKPPAIWKDRSSKHTKRVSTLGLYSTIIDSISNLPQPNHVRLPSVFEQKGPILVQDYSGSWSWSSYENEITGKHALYDGELKLIKYNEAYELYDLKSDSSEIENLFSDHPSSDELQNKLVEYLNEFNESSTSIDQIDINDETSEQLADLGYI